MILSIMLLNCSPLMAGNEQPHEPLNPSILRALEVEMIQESTDRRRQLSQQYFAEQKGKELNALVTAKQDKKQRDTFAIELAKAQYIKEHSNNN